MSQHDMVIDNGPGLAVRQDINAAIQALASTSSGPVEPTVKTPGMIWLDTSVAPDGLLRQRNLANDAWIPLKISATGPGQDIHAYPEKTVPSAFDEFPISNSTSTPAAWQAAKMTYANIKAAIIAAISLDKIFSAAADMALSFRAAGTPAGSLSRLVLNSKADLSGTDVAVIDDTGKMALGQATIPSMDQSLITASRITMQSGFAINAYVDPVGTPAWKATTTGFSMTFQMDKTNGVVTLTRSGASTAAGAAVASMPALMSFDGAGNANFSQSVIAAGNCYASGSCFISGTTNNIVATSGSGGVVYLRPNGVSSGAGQFYVQSDGQAVMNGAVVATNASAAAQVMPTVAAQGASGLGTYALANYGPGGVQGANFAAAGGNLRYSNVDGEPGNVVSAGTWRLMGQIASGAQSQTSLWLRYA